MKNIRADLVSVLRKSVTTMKRKISTHFENNPVHRILWDTDTCRLHMLPERTMAHKYCRRLAQDYRLHAESLTVGLGHSHSLKEGKIINNRSNFTCFSDWV